MYIQTPYFIEQFYMELGEFEDILETFFYSRLMWHSYILILIDNSKLKLHDK